jgi:hypothetical protein
MNRTIKEATVKRYHYDSHQLFEQHLADFINAYNYARRLKTLKRHTNTSAKSGQTSPSGSRSIPSTKCRD